jgi:transcriptional regulator with XRE-family HTH domain
MSDLLQHIVDGIPEERKRRFEYADQIAAYVLYCLRKKDMKNKDLAEKLGMYTSQLSRYTNGEANLNLETIARLELALDEQILHIRQVPEGAKESLSGTIPVAPDTDGDSFNLYTLRTGTDSKRSTHLSMDVSSTSDTVEETSVRYG